MMSRSALCKVVLPLIGVSYFFGTMLLFDSMSSTNYHRRLCLFMDNTDLDGTDIERYLASYIYGNVDCSIYYPEPPSIIYVEEGETPPPEIADGSGNHLTIFDVYLQTEEYSPTGEKEPRAGTVAYVLALTNCPEAEHPYVDNEYDPGAQFYDVSAIIKHSLCNVTVEGNVEYPFTMYAFVHPDAVVCQTPTGGTYDRVKMLQEMGYWVEIVGEAVTHDDIRDTQKWLSGHIFNDDVGMRDLIRLRLWQLTSHPIVVMMDFNTLMLKPLNNLFETFVNTEIKAMYVKNGDNEGVSTGLMLIKPSNETFQNLVDAYINTPYHNKFGWNEQGHNNFPGRLGVSGFLSYYFSGNPDFVELDNCIYGNDFGSSCVGTPFDDIVVGRFVSDHCGSPWTCPDHETDANPTCTNCQHKFYMYRYEFEKNHWSKKNKQERIGQYKYEAFLGYCKGTGEENYLGMTKNEPKPAWQKVCPPMECPPGSYVTNDCDCSPENDPCAACPLGTRCQLEPVLMCIDCECGFCNYEKQNCCSFNGVNNCKAELEDKECKLQNEFYAAWPGTGNACSGVEISDTATENGCGCQPNHLTPCTYDPNLKSLDDQCFICSAADLSLGLCPGCQECLTNCGANSCSTADSISDFETCFGQTSEECRVSCDAMCRKW